MSPKRTTSKPVKWIVRYGCGCTDDAARKSDLLEYCARHGHDAKEYIKLPRTHKAIPLPKGKRK